MKHSTHKLTFLALIVAWNVSLASGFESRRLLQQFIVTGQVTSAADGSALPGVSIVVKGTTEGTTTDSDGRYSLDVSPDATLVFSFVGFESQEVSVAGRSVINISLIESSQSLEEVVVIGYGSQSRETLTSSVSKMDAKVLENEVFGNVATALQGTVSGVRVQQFSGQPGTAPRIVMRGGTSINNPDGANPLYIVDGVIRTDLNGINAADIESMQILKDAAATAIYGARAANGVIIVTLKKGISGRTQLTYNYSLGFSTLREKYPVLNARDYIYYHRIAEAATAAANLGIYNPEDNYVQFAAEHNFGGTASPAGTGNDLTKNTFYTTQYLTPENEYKLNEGWESMEDPLYPGKTIIFKGTDWQDVSFRTGITHNHHVNLSGGSNAATFNLGLGYLDMEGMAIFTKYDRITGNLDGNLKIKDNLSAYGGVNFSREFDNRVYSENQLFERSITFSPTAKRFFEDGTPAPGYNETMGNPEYYLSRFSNEYRVTTTILRVGLLWEPLPGVTIEPSASLLNRITDRSDFRKSYITSTTVNATRPASGSYSNFDQKEFNAVINYQTSFNTSHNLHATVGTSYFDRKANSLSASGRGAATDNIPTMNASAEPVSVYSAKTQQRIIGFFGRFNYDYNRKYLLTLTARYDGASNLGRANKWGFFPGISAGWNVHMEDFWTNPISMSRLKLRVSYGSSGNLGNLGDYTPQGAYTVGARYMGRPVIEYSTIANEDLKWEESTTFNIGLETGFVDNRFELNAEYYRRVTDNLITSLAMPYESGFTSILTNLGSLENKGVEVELRANILRRSGLRWDVSFNASNNVNKILKLPENDNENNRIGGYLLWDEKTQDYVWKGGLQEGHTMGELYAYKQNGVYATQAEADAGPGNTMRLRFDEKNYAGDAKFYDADGDGLITPTDRVYVGNIYPDWTGGFTSTLGYGNFNLFVRLDYTVGHTIFNYVATSLNGVYAIYSSATPDVKRAWMKEGNITDVPKFYHTDQIARGNTWMGDPRNGNGAGSSYYYEKGDFLAVREVTLSYTLPQEWVKVIGMRNLRLNVTGSNLHYFTAYKGLAPEVGGIDHGRYPLPRVLTIAATATF
jgi:TonB-linked SusC/RagA family outer membrane protein